MALTPDETRLGDYRLKELLAEGTVTRTWLAEQVSVRRDVLVDELLPERADAREGFLADIRSKAAVDHPLIGSVYEAVANDQTCFFARERLPGATLGERQRANVPLKPAALANLLRRVAEANLYLESRNQDTAPLDPDDIHLDDSGVIRLVNLAVAGDRPPTRSTEDISNLGSSLDGIVADGQPGTTRILTLLAWMRGDGLDTSLTWEQVRDYAAEIEKQLADPTAGMASATARLAKGKKPPVLAMSIAGTLAVIALGVALSHSKQPRPQPPPPKASLPDAVLIPSGLHPTPDGTQEDLRSFRLSANEVTIGQYAEFLAALAVLANDHRERIFDHASQPPTKADHRPDDWETLYAAAKAEGTWQNRSVTLDTPVVGVDWWDASAYCEWKQGKLPSQEEWFAALRQQTEEPGSLKASTWLPVTADTPDRTPNGLLGMAGSVAEWTRTPSVNPANPLGGKLWVIIGGSYLKPANGALTREWTDDRALRRPDLGFRLATDTK